VGYSQNWGQAWLGSCPAWDPHFPTCLLTLQLAKAMAHLWHGILYCVMVHMGATGRGFAMDIVRLTWWYLVCITTYLLP